MKRTFNYTGRQKIDRKYISIVLSEIDSLWRYDAELNLTNYHFSRNAEVWIEAYRQNLWMQWSWGTIALPRKPQDRILNEFDDPEGVLFRVRVVQPPGQEHHKLLGEADGLNFVKTGAKEDHRRHLLEPVPDDLGQELWRLNFESDPPTLLVNREAHPSWKDIARNQHFISLVYPAVFRQILTKILITEEWDEADDPSGWEMNWILFTKKLGGLPAIPSVESIQEREAWIEDAVSLFCTKKNMRSNWDLLFDKEKQ